MKERIFLNQRTTKAFRYLRQKIIRYENRGGADASTLEIQDILRIDNAFFPLFKAILEEVKTLNNNAKKLLFCQYLPL